jgi:hypothetical protein
MKKTITIIAVSFLSVFSLKAQITADFESLVLPADSFYQDSTGADFINGDISFEYTWTESMWGDYWSGGFSYSNMTDSVTSGAGNQYSAKTAGGYNSTNYAVGYGGGVVRLLNASTGQTAQGFYITNSTYAYNSMRDGDMFAKKFGGASGNDPDWFKLVIRKYQAGVLNPTDSVEFYLADFRFADNSQDYILKTWQYLDLSSIGTADSFRFDLSSTDNSFGFMNTPAYFCIDDFSTNATIGLKETTNTGYLIFPNPAINSLTVRFNTPVKGNASYSIVDVTGKTVLANELETGTEKAILNIEHLNSGIYFLHVINGAEVITKKFTKE